MAAFMGTVGKVTVTSTTGATLLNVDEWSLDINAETPESTAFGAGSCNARDHLSGLHSASGSASGMCDGTTALSMSDFATPSTCSVSLGFDWATDRTFVFTAILTSYSCSTERGEVVRWTATFESSGAITPTAGSVA
jgi:hypothetical protein